MERKKRGFLDMKFNKSVQNVNKYLADQTNLDTSTLLRVEVR